MIGLKQDWLLEVPPRYFTLEDYEGGVARWCPGCGDHAVLAAVQRICREEQLAPEHTVCVSGIGCSSRFPHYMATYGFHGLHGRPLPVACGIKARRPDLHVWVATGDGDCCSIGAGHWIHAIRYNMNMVVMLFDNRIYGLTKKQTSPTTAPGFRTNTHPKGAWLPPLNPTEVTLGFTNASFVARTIDWNPPHVLSTLRAAFHHRGLSFVHIMQRCPQYTALAFEDAQRDPSLVMVLEHELGIPAGELPERVFTNRAEHDPRKLGAAIEIARRDDCLPIGLLFHDPSRPCYDDFCQRGLDMNQEDKLAGLERELDRYAI